MKPEHPIKRDYIDTSRNGDSSGGEAKLTTATLSMISHRHPADQGPAPLAGWQYGAPMAIATSAAAIAAALREQLSERITYLPDRKLHALLYLAQLNTLAANDEALFPDPIRATSHGVELGPFSRDVAPELTGAQFSAVVHTAGNYGGLPATDLEALIRGQRPWQQARNSSNNEITAESVREWVRSLDDDPHASITGRTRSWLAATRGYRTARDTTGDRRDSAEERAAFIAEVRSRM